MKPTFHDNLKGISVCGVYAHLLVHGGQGEETRSRTTKHRGWACVHVPQSTGWDDTFESYGLDPALCPKKHLIGAVRIDDVYYDGIYHLVIGDSLPFPEPIPGAKGQRSVVWTPTPDSYGAFNKAWETMLGTLVEEDLLESMDPSTYT